MNFNAVNLLMLFGESILLGFLYSFFGMGFMGLLVLLSGGYLLTRLPKWANILLFPAMVFIKIMGFLCEKFSIKEDGVLYVFIMVLSSVPFALVIFIVQLFFLVLIDAL